MAVIGPLVGVMSVATKIGLLGRGSAVEVRVRSTVGLSVVHLASAVRKSWCRPMNRLRLTTSLLVSFVHGTAIASAKPRRKSVHEQSPPGLVRMRGLTSVCRVVKTGLKRL